VANRRVREAIDRAGEVMLARGSHRGIYLKAISRATRPLQEAAARRAFLQTLRSVIDVRGQHVSAVDRLYLLGELPTLIVWGERDNTIPVDHGRAAHELIPNSRFVTLPRAAHFPNLENPEGLADALLEWLDETEPGLIEDSEWGKIVGARSPRPQRPSTVA
ncbi:MAG TPA: alpha/beta hydrolase, partial [Solirubrobacterales bacterium]|nr:alpha/beta hydrolase [Solirubrobacterales bacterium]